MRVVPIFAIVTAVAHSLTAFGALYVTDPTPQTVCHGGKPCLVAWLDNGQSPLLTTMGPCHVALFSGIGDLIQQIEPVDVSTSHSLSFTPSPNAGPNSSNYYIQFTSVTSSNSSQPLVAYSPNFSLDRMTGSFNSKVPKLTSTIPVPSSVLSAHGKQNKKKISPLQFGTTSSTSTSLTSSSTPHSSGPSPSSTSRPASATTSASANAATRYFSQHWVATLAGLPFIFFM